MNYKQNNIVVSFIVWHFYDMLKSLLLIWRDYLWFSSNFFSISFLFSTLLSPWRRYQWRYPKGFDIGGFFSSLVSNIFSRIIGLLVRIVLIIFGIFFQAAVFLIGIFVIIFWILIPLILILLLFIIMY